MRMIPLTLITLLCSTFGSAQDAGQQQMMITQQNLQIQATQQANQQTVQALQDSQRFSQQANQDAINALQICDQCQRASAPKASLAPGNYPGAVTIRLKSRTRHAHLFYTTDGWTPTTQSIPYTGPITLSSSETLRVIAVAPGSARSNIVALTYTLPASRASAPSTAITPHLLPAGTPLRLRFTSPLDSATAYVGQTFQLALADNLVADGHTLATTGTQAQAVVTEVDPARRASLPGSITFAVKSIRIDGKEVPLSGVRTLEASDHVGREALFLIPVVGAASALKHGDTARILPGAELIAQVTTDFTL